MGDIDEASDSSNLAPMAKYYFDVIVGGETELDEHGLELSRFEDVRREAGRILTDIAKFEISNADELMVEVSVRESEGSVVYYGDLSFRTHVCAGTAKPNPETGMSASEQSARL